jgi:hypothetical protein
MIEQIGKVVQALQEVGYGMRRRQVIVTVVLDLVALRLQQEQMQV